LHDVSRYEWRCPCPECNGIVPDRTEPDYEPEHPENVSPERYGYTGDV
jgi:hypothetical protein